MHFQNQKAKIWYITNIPINILRHILNNIIKKYIGIKTPFTKVRKVLETYESQNNMQNSNKQTITFTEEHKRKLGQEA